MRSDSASLVHLSERCSPCLSPLPRRDRRRISPYAEPCSSCPSYQLFKDHIPRSILPVPPAPALFGQLVVDVASIREECIGHRAPVLVLAVGLERDFLAESPLRSGWLGSLAVGSALLWAVNAVQSNALGSVVVQDVDGVAIEDRDDRATSFISERVGKPHQTDGATQQETVLGDSLKQWHNPFSTVLLHLLRVLIDHQMRIGRPVKHDVDPGRIGFGG